MVTAQLNVNAAKFAGEIDALEAMDAVKRHYRIDEDRIPNPDTITIADLGAGEGLVHVVHHTERAARRRRRLRLLGRRARAAR